jgi:spoIIIJ-associated protein
VEWVEVTGKTVGEATEAALDQLGVAAGDAEVIVVDEPKTGLFGRVRGEARVRARVRPVGPRPRRTRRPRERAGTGSRSGSGGSRGSRGGRSGQGGGRAAEEAGADRAPSGDGDGAAAGNRQGSGGDGARRPSRRGRGGRGRGSGNGSRPAADGGGARKTQGSEEEAEMAEGMTLEEQATVAKEFLEGLLDRFGLEASVATRELDEETVEIAATGESLGILVGPRGATLAAVQEVTRTVVQRQCPSRTDRILVDIAGYREKRAAALKRFSTQIAEEVISSGEERPLEAMSPADRKVVHDSVNEIDGVVTRSEGEDPHRYVVIAPGG